MGKVLSGGGGSRTRVLSSNREGFYKLSCGFSCRPGVSAAAASPGAIPESLHLTGPGVRLWLSMIYDTVTPYHAWGGRIRLKVSTA